MHKHALTSMPIPMHGAVGLLRQPRAHATQMSSRTRPSDVHSRNPIAPLPLFRLYQPWHSADAPLRRRRNAAHVLPMHSPGTMQTPTETAFSHFSRGALGTLSYYIPGESIRATASLARGACIAAADQTGYQQERRGEISTARHP
jgi:hypothetical protein